MYGIYGYIDPPGTTPTDRHIWQSHGVYGYMTPNPFDHSIWTYRVTTICGAWVFRPDHSDWAHTAF